MNNEQVLTQNAERIMNWQWSDIADEPLVRAMISYVDATIPDEELFSSVYEVFPDEQPEVICRRGLFRALGKRNDSGEPVISQGQLEAATSRIAALAGSRQGDLVEKLAKNAAANIFVGADGRASAEIGKLCKFALIQMEKPVARTS